MNIYKYASSKDIDKTYNYKILVYPNITYMKDLEKEAIIRTLRFFNNNRRKTARSLGVSERTLYRKIEDYKLEPKIKRS